MQATDRGPSNSRRMQSLAKVVQYVWYTWYTTVSSMYSST